MDYKEEIIPRSLDPDLEKILEEFGNGIDRLVNFGSNIIAWNLDKKDGGDEDLPAILFLRNFLEEIDAISILIRKSSIDSCNNLLRTALENFFCVCYLIEKDFKQRSMAFLVCNALNNRKNIERVDGRSEEFKRMEKIFKNDRLLRNTNLSILPNADKYLEDNQNLLELPKFKAVKHEYDITKKRLKRRPVWYSLFNGPTNLEALATQLGYPAIYEVLYRAWSTSIHGNDIIQGKLSGTEGNKAAIVQIRLPNNAQSVTQNCFNLSIILFKEYIEKLIPNRIMDFRTWYGSIREFSIRLGKNQFINVTD